MPWYLLLLVLGLGYGIPLGLAMSLAWWGLRAAEKVFAPQSVPELQHLTPVQFGLAVAVLGGIAFGTAMTISIRRKARQLNLGTWAGYKPAEIEPRVETV
jgi:hypothetical protein